jgi:hypothetical protein
MKKTGHSARFQIPLTTMPGNADNAATSNGCR